MKKFTVGRRVGRKYRNMGITRKFLKKHISKEHKDFFIYPFNNNLAVNKNGVVLRVDKDKPIPVSKDSNGRNYIQTFIIEDGVKKRINYYPYRLVAYMFIPKPSKYAATPYSELEVNHKDGNKTNDNIKNLEWVDTRENIQHAYNNDLNTRADKIICKHLDTGKTITFRSISSAAEYFNIGIETLRKKLYNESFFYYKLVKDTDEYIFRLVNSNLKWSPIPKEYLTPVTKENNKLKDQIVIINRKTKDIIIVKNKLEINKYSDIDLNKQTIFLNFKLYGFFKSNNFLLYPYLYFIKLMLKDQNKIKEEIKSNENLYYSRYKNAIICKNIKTKEELYFPTAVDMGNHFKFNAAVLCKRLNDVSYWNYKIDDYKFRLASDMDWPSSFNDNMLKDIRIYGTRESPLIVKNTTNGDLEVYDNIKEVATKLDIKYNTLKSSLARKDKYIVGFLEISYAK